MSAPSQDSGTDVLIVCGSSRSGTTMMSRILGRASDVHALHELHFVERLWSPTTTPQAVERTHAIEIVESLLERSRNLWLKPGDPKDYTAEATAIVDGAPDLEPPTLLAATIASESAAEGKRIACLQTPRNVFYLEELLAALPSAHAIVMVRDPRAVLLSQKHKLKAESMDVPRREQLRVWANYHPVTTSLLWRAAIRAGQKLGDHPRVHVIRFEDLAGDPATSLEALCGDIGITYDPGMLDVPQDFSSTRTEASSELGVDSSVVDRWRTGDLTPAEIDICERVTAAEMAAYGYEPLAGRPGPASLARHAATFVAKTGLAVGLNANRFSDIGSAVRRRLAG